LTYGETLNDYIQAIYWYESAANKHNRDSYHSLGLIYDFGKGVEQDYAKAFKYYQLGANLGEATSHANLGFMYESGKGVSVSNEMAFKHYEKAAEQDDPQGLNNLGTFYLHGIVAKQDKKKAISLYKRAAELNNDFEPLSDFRASKEYRSLTAANMLRRYFIETQNKDNQIETRVTSYV
jgi:TPR repeat protein